MFKKVSNLNLNIIKIPNHIQYKKVVVPGKYENAHALNVATWHKRGYFMSKIYVTELDENKTKPFFKVTKPYFYCCERACHFQISHHSI
jgi:hypothetical protein